MMSGVMTVADHRLVSMSLNAPGVQPTSRFPVGVVAALADLTR